MERTCESCRKPFNAKPADVKRGWARFCSKRCKAINQSQEMPKGAGLYPIAGDLDDVHDLDDPIL